jgi:hypothetical protein
LFDPVGVVRGRRRITLSRGIKPLVIQIRPPFGVILFPVLDISLNFYYIITSITKEFL